MTTTHFVLVDDKLTTNEIQNMCSEIKDLKGIHNVLAYEEFVGQDLHPTLLQV